MATAAHVAGSAAEGVAARKSTKYSDIETNYMFQPIAVGSLGPMNVSKCAFLSKLGRKLSTHSKRPAFCFNDSPFSFSISMLFYFLTVF